MSSKLYNSPFLNQFRFNLDQLEYRLKRALSIDTFDKQNQSEYLMCFDSALALFRAVFLEKLDKNYTYQSYLKAIGRDDLADKLDGYLDSEFDVTGQSIRKVLKFLADKFVCHVDSLEAGDIGLANYYMSCLNNPAHDNNLRCIVDRIKQITRIENEDELLMEAIKKEYEKEMFEATNKAEN